MPHREDANEPVKAKAVLIDPASMAVLWLNEAASHALTGRDDAPVASVTLGHVANLVGAPDLEEALRAAAQDREPRHLRAGFVNTARGGLAMATSIYPLPDGLLLIVSENAWQARPGRPTRG